MTQLSPTLKAELLVIGVVVVLMAFKSFRYVDDETRIVLRGELTLERVVEVEELLRQGRGQFNTLQLVDSPGAGAAAGIIVDRLEALINRYRLNTEVRGRCASACAAVFLLGNHRRMLAATEESPTFLMIHAVRNFVSGEVNYGKTEAINKKIAAKSQQQFSIKLLNRLFDDKKGTGDGEIYLFREPQTIAQTKAQVFVCDSKLQQQLDQCEAIPRMTPQSLGIILVSE
ncbi:MAG: hypothetical protein HY253_13395 [Burkholderiales bacterium]|nr:hypothetical protein [Burkholderiales bacterium]